MYVFSDTHALSIILFQFERALQRHDTVEYQITGNQGSYTLKPGESLVRVALKFYGNKKLWPYLVKHNKAIIKNPDNVPVGTTIQIPQLTPKK